MDSQQWSYELFRGYNYLILIQLSVHSLHHLDYSIQKGKFLL